MHSQKTIFTSVFILKEITQKMMKFKIWSMRTQPPKLVSGIIMYLIFDPHFILTLIYISYQIMLFQMQVAQGEESYISVFEIFREALKEVVTRNKNKRVKVHLR